MLDLHAHQAVALVLALLSFAIVAMAAPDDAAEAPPRKQKEPKHEAGVYDESLVPGYTLPDPRALPDGSRVTDAATWERVGRPHTLELFRAHVFGRSPKVPEGTRFEVVAEDPRAVDGTATHRQVRFIVPRHGAGEPFTFEASLLVPNAADGPVPTFLLLNNRLLASADPSRQHKAEFWPAEEILARGYATAVLQLRDVQPDRPGALNEGLVAALPRPGTAGQDQWATIGAWAWAASRMMDYLATDPAIDASKVAVIGHSRGGKTALWAGAQDERFALVISNESGEGGAALARRRFGETVGAITWQFGYWFCDTYATYAGREDEMPFDQHQLLALIAPRALAVGSAADDLWADPRGEYLGLAATDPVYALYDQPTFGDAAMPALNTPLVSGRRQYHIRPGEHGLTRTDWDSYLDLADRIWPR